MDGDGVGRRPTEEIFMRVIRSVFLGLLVGVLPSWASHAQGTDWNRQVARILLDETTTSGEYDVRARFDILASGIDTSAPSDVSTEVEVRVNGGTVGTGVVPVSVTSTTPSSCVPAACGGSCGGGTFDGASGVMGCRPDGAAACECASPELEFALPMVPLQPGDEIMVLLRPAPGALPDADPSDDIGILSFGSWNRTLESFDVEPDPAGPGSIIRANFHVQLFEQNSLPLPMDTRITFEQNGSPVGDEIMVILMPAPGAQPFCAPAACGAGVCGQADVNGVGNDMFCDPVECDCRLQGLSLQIPTPTPVPPGDEITVILRPAPGALPELPGFGDDELPRPDPVPAMRAVGLLVAGGGIVIAMMWRFRRS
jgi:hypothetical protein